MTKSTDKKTIKKRDPSIDLIRVIACLLVVGTHVDLMGTGDATKLLIRLIFADGVTLFFILSGFFFFKKGFKDTLKRTLTGIVLPGVIVMLLSYQFAPFIRDEQTLLFCLTHLNFDIRGFITDVLSWGGTIRESLAGHLWYIFTYLELVLAYPLLRPLYTKSVYKQAEDVDKADTCSREQVPDDIDNGVKSGQIYVDKANVSGSKLKHITTKIYAGDTYCKYRWFIMIFIFVNQIIMDFNMTGLISLCPVQISPFMLYTAPAMLMMIGAEIAIIRGRLEDQCGKADAHSKMSKGITALIICVLTFIVRFFMQRLVFKYNQSQDFYLYWNCAFATIQSTSFVIFVLCMDLRDNKLVNFVARAGRYTFYVYLLHYAVYYAFYYRVEPDWCFGLIDLTGGYNTMGKELMHILIRVPTVFLLSLALSFAVMKTGDVIGGFLKKKKA